MNTDNYSNSTAAHAHPPRVLHILEATLGGTMRYLANILVASAGSHIQFGFAYANARSDHQLQPFLAEAVRQGWKLFQFETGREISPQRDLAACLELARVFRSFRPDIIHCHSSKAGAIGRLASFALWPKPKVIYSPHALATSNPLFLFIERVLSWTTDRFAAVSASEREQMIALRVGRAENIDVLYPSIDTTYFAPCEQWSARRHLLLPERPIIVGIGRLTEQKNPLQFLQVIATVRESFPDVLGIWVGDGELREAVEAEIARLNLAPNILLAGWQSDPRPYLGSADVLLSTSRFESFGYMVAEALAMQVPVVASRVCGTVDIMSGYLAASLFTSNDTAQAAQKIAALLRHPDLRKNLGLKGRSTIVNCFGPESMRSRLGQHYCSLIQAYLLEGVQFSVGS